MFVVDGSTANVTGPPDPLVAVRSSLVPTLPEVGRWKWIAWVPFGTWIVWVAWAAEADAALTALTVRSAAMTQVPAWSKVTLLPAREQAALAEPACVVDGSTEKVILPDPPDAATT